MEDFDIPQNKMADSAERVVDRALEEARRREHALLTNEHVCLAFAQVEWDMFGQVMSDLELNPHEILQALEEHLRLHRIRRRHVALIRLSQLISQLLDERLALGVRQLKDIAIEGVLLQGPIRGHATAELRARNRQSHVPTPMTAARIAACLAKIETPAAILLQRRRDQETRAVLQGIESAPRAPASPWEYVPLAACAREPLPVDAGAVPVDLATLQV